MLDPEEGQRTEDQLEKSHVYGPNIREREGGGGDRWLWSFLVTRHAHRFALRNVSRVNSPEQDSDATATHSIVAGLG